MKHNYPGNRLYSFPQIPITSRMFYFQWFELVLFGGVSIYQATGITSLMSGRPRMPRDLCALGYPCSQRLINKEKEPKIQLHQPQHGTNSNKRVSCDQAETESSFESFPRLRFLSISSQSFISCFSRKSSFNKSIPYRSLPQALLLKQCYRQK